MKIIVAPDKFKGSLTSFEACRSISSGIKKKNEKAEVIQLPMADGGDGFSLVLKHYFATNTVFTNTVDPLGRDITASYQWDGKNKTAIIELAVASGLVLLKKTELNPLLTSAFGTGLLIKDAIAKGAEKVILGLGGSATNDAGTGILSALGFQLQDDKGEPLQASGENLLYINKIIPPSFIPPVQFEMACDVQNVLHGLQGAAHVYAPQKGANDKDVAILDKGLRNFSEVIKSQTGQDISSIPGTGAAGGIAAGLLGFFAVKMKKGIELILQASQVEKQLSGVSLLITGEGKVDEQSGAGKVVGHVAALARQHHIPCIAICGITELTAIAAKKLGLQRIIAIRDQSISEEEAMKNAFKLIEKNVMTLPELL